MLFSSYNDLRLDTQLFILIIHESDNVRVKESIFSSI